MACAASLVQHSWHLCRTQLLSKHRRSDLPGARTTESFPIATPRGQRCSASLQGTVELEAETLIKLILKQLARHFRLHCGRSPIFVSGLKGGYHPHTRCDLAKNSLMTGCCSKYPVGTPSLSAVKSEVSGSPQNEARACNAFKQIG